MPKTIAVIAIFINNDFLEIKIASQPAQSNNNSTLFQINSTFGKTNRNDCNAIQAKDAWAKLRPCMETDAIKNLAPVWQMGAMGSFLYADCRCCDNPGNDEAF